MRCAACGAVVGRDRVRLGIRNGKGGQSGGQAGSNPRKPASKKGASDEIRIRSGSQGKNEGRNLWGKRRDARVRSLVCVCK